MNAWGRERGSVSAFVAVLALALFATGGLVYDGALGLAAARRANDLAEGAARAGVAGGAVPGPSGMALDPGRARRSALAYLALSGRNQGASISVLSERVVVRLALVERTSLLGIVGVDRLVVEGRGEARPASGIEREGG